MTLAAAMAFPAIGIVAAWLFQTRRVRPQTTEDTWCRVVAMHMENATPKRGG